MGQENTSSTLKYTVNYQLDAKYKDICCHTKKHLTFLELVDVKISSWVIRNSPLPMEFHMLEPLTQQSGTIAAENIQQPQHPPSVETWKKMLLYQNLITVSDHCIRT